MICPSRFVDLNTAGSVYFLKHKPKSEYGKDLDKIVHFSLAVDITGSSTSKEFVATHFDIFIVHSTDHTTYMEATFKRRLYDDYLLIKQIGKILLNHIQEFFSPIHFAQNLRNQLIQNVYNPMCKNNNGALWSSTLNCQTFTRSAIEYLGFHLPPNTVILSDCIPTMVDMYMNISLAKTQTKEKLNEKKINI
ncbi:unnamed protein product [Rotaria magnacalcarata]|nr:unnamed protein product [Rotaria magnacalcarata]